MAAIGKLGYYRLAFFSKPREDRALYRTVKRLKARKIVEVGMGTLPRALALVRIAQRYSPGQAISYAGIDMFDERPASRPRLRLIDAHRALLAEGATTRLMPSGAGLAALANALSKTDLVVISPEVSDAELDTSWFYLPRMLHANSLVLRGTADPAQPQNVSWRSITLSEIQVQASGSKRAA